MFNGILLLLYDTLPINYETSFIQFQKLFDVEVFNYINFIRFSWLT